MDEYEETELDLVDLIYQVVIKNIKKIVIVGLIGALLGFSIAFIKSNHEEKIVEALLTDETAALEEYEDDISKSDLVDVDIYTNNQFLYERQEDYVLNSVKLNLTNTSAMYTFTAQYRVTNTDNIDGVVSFLNTQVIDDDYLDSVYDDLGLANNSQYYTKSYFMNELISIYSPSSDNIGMNSNERIVFVKFYYDNKEKVNDIGNDLCTRINSLISYIKEETGATMKLINISDAVVDYSSIDNQKLTSLTNLNTLSESMKDSYDDFSKIQLRYYAAKNPDEEIKIGSGRIKYSVIGFIIGAFIICCYYGVIYMLGGTVHTVGELDGFHLHIFGTIGKQRNYIINKENIISIETLQELINLDLKKKGIKSIILASSLPLEAIKEVSDQISSKVKVDESYGDVLNNSEFIATCKKEVAVVYIEVLNESKTKDIQSLEEYNKAYNVNSLGYVMVSK